MPSTPSQPNVNQSTQKPALPAPISRQEAERDPTTHNQGVHNHNNRFLALRDRDHSAHISNQAGATTAQDPHHNAPSDNEGFSFPKRRNRRVLTGRCTSDPQHRFKGAPEPSRDLFIFRVHPDTETNELKQYLSSRKVNIRELKLVSNPAATFKSFKLSVPVSNFKSLFDDTFWPEGVCIRKYVSPKQ